MTTDNSRALVVGSKELMFPAYFPSISSVKTPLPPLDYLRILSSLTGLTDKFLVSAYDLYPLEDEDKAGGCIDSAGKSGGIVLMDSGNYESFWKDDRENWKQAKFHSMLEKYVCDLAFGFDEQQPPPNQEKHVDIIIKRWEHDQKCSGGCRIIPIVHGEAVSLPGLCYEVARRSGIEFIAVPERRLGNGLIERALAIKNIRTSLDSLGRNVFLHVLGTGNPTSMAVFTLQGADSFDGLEWCQTVVDHETALLYHLSQFDFFVGQTCWSDVDVPFHIKVLAHNLEFYKDWMGRFQKADSTEGRIEFCRFNFPDRIFRTCSELLDWIAP